MSAVRWWQTTTTKATGLPTDRREIGGHAKEEVWAGGCLNEEDDDTNSMQYEGMVIKYSMVRVRKREWRDPVIISPAQDTARLCRALNPYNVNKY